MVCTSCKTSYNVLISGRGVHLHWGGGVVGSAKKESHQILDRSLEVGTSVMPLYSICTSNLPPPPPPLKITTGFYFTSNKFYYPRYSLFATN